MSTPKPTNADRIVVTAAVAEITIDLKAIASTINVTPMMKSRKSGARSKMRSAMSLRVGATTDFGAGVIAAAILGLAVAAALWWAYFDVVAIVAERRLREASGSAQLKMARDSYSYLHLPMVAGIVLFAVGVKKTLIDIGEPLATVPAVALCGGVALYLVAHILFRLRNVQTLNRQRLVVSALLLGLVPVAVEIPALVTLALVASLCVGLIAYEAIRFAEARDRIRHAPEPST